MGYPQPNQVVTALVGPALTRPLHADLQDRPVSRFDRATPNEQPLLLVGAITHALPILYQIPHYGSALGQTHLTQGQRIVFDLLALVSQ